MAEFRLLIEVFGGAVQNVYASSDDSELRIDAVVIDWDRRGVAAPTPAWADSGHAAAALPPGVLRRPRMQPWHSLSAAGIQDLLDQAGLAAFAAPLEPRRSREARDHGPLRS